MGQKVHPFLLRVGYIQTWHSRWFAKSPTFADYVEEDYRIRRLIKKRYKQAAISKIIIERLIDKVRIRIVCKAGNNHRAPRRGYRKIKGRPQYLD